MLFEPLDRRANFPAAQVHHQVDGASATLLAMPVEESDARHGQRTLPGAPLSPAAPITHRPPLGQYDVQRNRADCVGASAEVAECHRTLLIELVAQALAILDVDDIAVLGQPIDQGGGQVVVVKKRTPFGEAQI